MIHTVAGPPSVVQWVLSGGPYTVASHVRLNGRASARGTTTTARCRCSACVSGTRLQVLDAPIR
jgi:hypothetical protein